MAARLDADDLELMLDSEIRAGCVEMTADEIEALARPCSKLTRTSDLETRNRLHWVCGMLSGLADAKRTA